MRRKYLIASVAGDINENTEAGYELDVGELTVNRGVPQAANGPFGLSPLVCGTGKANAGLIDGACSAVGAGPCLGDGRRDPFLPS